MRKTLVPVPLLALSLLTLGASGCSGCGKADAAAGAPSPSASASAAQLPAGPQELTAFSAVPLGAKDPESLMKFKGSVILVVNTASHCGYTPQYTPLGEIERKYQAKGFHVLGFVSNDFGGQAGTTEEVKSCSAEHQATFPQFAEIKVKKGPGQDPIFAWLTSDPKLPGDVTWNFNKWLIDRQGHLVARWASPVVPDGPEITQAIERELGK